MDEEEKFKGIRGFTLTVEIDAESPEKFNIMHNLKINGKLRYGEYLEMITVGIYHLVNAHLKNFRQEEETPKFKFNFEDPEPDPTIKAT